jgi:hypothetical protein
MRCDCCRDEITVAKWNGELSYFRKELIKKSEGHELCRQCLTDIASIKYSPLNTKARQIAQASHSCSPCSLTEKEMDELDELDYELWETSRLGIQYMICIESSDLRRDMQSRIHDALTDEVLDSITLPDDNLYNEIAVRRVGKILGKISSITVKYSRIKCELIDRRASMGLAGLQNDETELLNDLIDVFNKHRIALKELE